MKEENINYEKDLIIVKIKEDDLFPWTINNYIENFNKLKKKYGGESTILIDQNILNL